MLTSPEGAHDEHYNISIWTARRFRSQRKSYAGTLACREKPPDVWPSFCELVRFTCTLRDVFNGIKRNSRTRCTVVYVCLFRHAIFPLVAFAKNTENKYGGGVRSEVCRRCTCPRAPTFYQSSLSLSLCTSGEINHRRYVFGLPRGNGTRYRLADGRVPLIRSWTPDAYCTLVVVGRHGMERFKDDTVDRSTSRFIVRRIFQRSGRGSRPAIECTSMA